MEDDFKLIKRSRLNDFEKYLCDVFDNIVIVPFGETTFYNHEGKVIFVVKNGGVSIKYKFKDSIEDKFKMEYNEAYSLIRKFIKFYFKI